MKKNLALILALVMLMGTVFSVIPMAAATDATPSAVAASYEPKISYASVSYSDEMYVKFAVPAAALGEGEAVKLLVWGQGASDAYSFKEDGKTVLVSDGEVTISEKNYYVYKYEGLAAADMTKIIAVRPVLTKTWSEEKTTVVTPEEKNEAGEVIKPAETKTEIITHEDVITYGEVVEYSVLEYVATAKGEFEGIAALPAEVLAMLDAMVEFGAIAQEFSGKDYEFLANDELGKIWYTPVINGVKGAKVFGGFFKKGAESVSVSAPHLDEYKFVGFVDAEGKEIGDFDNYLDNGLQMAVPAEGDLELNVAYSTYYMISADPNLAAERKVLGWTSGKNNFSLGMGGMNINASSGNDTAISESDPTYYAPYHEDFNFCGLAVVQDPYSTDANENTYRISGNNSYALMLSGAALDNANGWKLSMQPDLAAPGFGDTVPGIVTIDFSLACGPNGELPNFGYIDLRSNSASGDIMNIGKFSDGKFLLVNDDPATATIEHIVCPTPVSAKGYTRFCIIIDAINEVCYVYAAAEGGELVYQAQSSSLQKKGKHVNKSWLEVLLDVDRLEWKGDKYASTRMTAEEKQMLADLDGDGIGETPMYTGSYEVIETTGEDGKVTTTIKNSEDFKVNKAAVQWFYENYCAYYLKSIGTYVGSPIEVLPQSFDMFDVDANDVSADTTYTKNSQIWFQNWGDEVYTNASKLNWPAGDYNFGGIGINTSDPANGPNENKILNYAGVDVIADPYQEGNKVYSFNGNLGAVLWQAGNTSTAGIRPAYTQALKISSRAPGFFNGSVVPVITYDMTVGGNGYDRMLETDTIRLRGASATWVHLYKIAADGEIIVCQANADKSAVEYINTGVYVSKSGYTRIVAEVDCANEEFRLFAAEEGKGLERIATVDALWVTGKAPVTDAYKAFDSWMAMAKVLDRTEILIAAGAANALTETELATVETLDAAAAQNLYRQYRALLIKDWDSYLGLAK